MQKLRAILGGSSPIAVTAFLSILVLVGVASARTIAYFMPPVTPAVNVASAAETASGTPVDDAAWRQEMILLGLLSSTDASVATSTDHLAMIGPMVMGELLGSYEAIREQGDYTPEDLRTAASRVAVYMKAAVTYDAFAASDFRSVNDTSTQRVRQYRDDLLLALEPISSIREAEYETFARYEETKDVQNLAQLKAAASAYRTAALNASSVTVPSDALNLHRDVLNSLRAFAPVLDGLADHADDPFASAALLRTYNEKEQGIKNAYENMRAYYAKKAL